MPKNTLDEELIEHHSFLVEKGHEVIRLDKFLMLRLANKSRNRIQNCILNRKNKRKILNYRFFKSKIEN